MVKQSQKAKDQTEKMNRTVVTEVTLVQTAYAIVFRLTNTCLDNSTVTLRKSLASTTQARDCIASYANGLRSTATATEGLLSLGWRRYLVRLFAMVRVFCIIRC